MLPANFYLFKAFDLKYSCFLLLLSLIPMTGVPACSTAIGEFASGDVPVWGGFIHVFVLEVQKAGYKINIISPDDYGIHFYGDV